MATKKDRRKTPTMPAPALLALLACSACASDRPSTAVPRQKAEAVEQDAKEPAPRYRCLTVETWIDPPQVAWLDVGSGKVEHIVPVNHVSVSDLSSLAHIDEQIYFCDHDDDSGEARGPVRLHLADGRVDKLRDEPCGALTGDDQGLVLVEGPMGQALRTYPLTLASGSGKTLPAPPRVSRISKAGDLLVGAWHSTDTIEVYRLSTQEKLSPVKLDGWNDWIMGLSLTSDGVLIVTNQRGKVALFDLATGTARQRLELEGRSLQGLACELAPEGWRL